jgi:cholesterol transport system auxiliary component
MANVEISAKILNDRNGSVRAQSVFKATSPVRGTENSDFVEALDRAFAKVGGDIVDWSLKSM